MALIMRAHFGAVPAIGHAAPVAVPRLGAVEKASRMWHLRIDERAEDGRRARKTRNCFAVREGEIEIF
jgi:hypothetical protein